MGRILSVRDDACDDASDDDWGSDMGVLPSSTSTRRPRPVRSCGGFADEPIHPVLHAG